MPGPEGWTAVFERTEGWWIGWVEELPGANTQGRTLAEARENLRDAVELIVQVNREMKTGCRGDIAPS